ncbi:MAG: SIR2 family protein [Bacilli bacterium]
MKTGFLLGAGFSKGLHHGMPLMRDLLNQLDLPDYIPSPVRSDLEQTLSLLWTNYPWHREREHYRNREVFLGLSEQLHKIITTAEHQAWSDIFAGHPEKLHGTPQYPPMNSEPFIRHQKPPVSMLWQAGLAGLLADNTRFCSVTMNYDTLLERFTIMNQSIQLLYPAPLQPLDRIWNQIKPYQGAGYYDSDSLPIQSGGYFPHFVPLYKLHGSVSWYALDAIESNTPIYCVDMNREYAQGEPSSRDVDNTLFSIIIPPVADKSALYGNKILRSQWVAALKALQECDTLYCVGYSFPTSDLPMRLFMAQASINIKRIVIVNVEEDPILLERYQSVLPANIQVEWIPGQTCVRDMALKLLKEPYPDTEII